MKFVINGVQVEPAEGLTLGEAREIKRIAGINLSELGEAFAAGDPDAMIALIYVSGKRSILDLTPDIVAEQSIENLVVHDDEEEADDAEGDAAPLGEPVTVEPPAKLRAKRGAGA